MAPERPGSCVEGEAGAAVPGQQRPAVPVPVVLHAHQLKEGDGAVRCVDDDLTSLTWLQDKNLLKGINLRGGGLVTTQGSPTSDYVDEGSCCSTSEPADSGGSSGGQSPSPAAASPPLARLKHPQHVPYDPQVHTSSKPPYSFSCLIFMAIEDSPQRALPVKEIYAWILEHFPYFKNAPTGWKNSVRHNLSLNKCFRKVEKAPNLGKGSLWMVDPMYRPNLLQALSKSPFHPYSSQSGRQSSGSSTPTQSPTKPSILRGSRQPSSASCDNLPDPVLFPYLSRRLAQAGEDGEESPDDVDAATAMLALKHGHRAGIHRRDDWYKRLRENSEEGNTRKKMRTGKCSQDNFANKIKMEESGEDQAKTEATEGMVITTSPSEDHTYSAALNLSAKAQPPSSSPDEAFEEGTDSEEDGCRPCLHAADMVKCELDEEQRKIAEGADALLNLAGIATVHSRGKLGQQHHNNNNTIAVNNNKLERSQHQAVPAPGGRSRKGGQPSGRLRKKPLPQRRVRGGGKR